MKRYTPLILILAALSTVSGYLMSEASWIGRIGMSLFYRQYNFLKIWWQGALAVFCVLLALLAVLAIAQRKFAAQAKILTTVIMMSGLFGLYLTYHDFRHDLSHRWMGERFHMGAYIFWLGWILVCLFFLFLKRPTKRDKSPSSM